MLWSLGLTLSVVSGGWLFALAYSWWSERESYQPVLSAYLAAATSGRSSEAFSMLCPAAQLRLQDFEARLSEQLAPLGRVNEIRGLRFVQSAGSNIGTRLIDGADQDIVVHIPMTHSDGKWRPCPLDSPLGRAEGPE